MFLLAAYLRLFLMNIKAKPPIMNTTRQIAMMFFCVHRKSSSHNKITDRYFKRSAFTLLYFAFAMSFTSISSTGSV